MPTKIDTDYLLRVVDALPEDLRLVAQMAFGIDGEEYTCVDIGRALKTTSSRIQAKLGRATRLILMAIDNPELEASDLPDLLAVARIRRLADKKGPTSDNPNAPRRTNEAPQLHADAD